MSRRRAVLLAAVAGLALTASPAVGATSLSGLVRGGTDIDVRLGDVAGSGALVGTVHGSVTASGRGLGTFRPSQGRRRLGVVVALRGTLSGAGARLRLRGSGLTGTVTVGADGKATGSGTLGGTRVNLSGVTGDALPRLRSGMRMLVVGKPSGEAWEALRTRWRPVAYDPAKHGRRAFLSDRAGFHGFAALVFGAGVSDRQIAASPVLHSFVNAGKWVVVAPATPARLDGLAGVFPYDPGVASPGVAMRATGREGGLTLVKPVVVFPDLPAVSVATGGPPAIPSVPASRLKDAANRRRSFFLTRLERLSPATLATARDVPPPGAKTAKDSATTFQLPANAQAIEVTVSGLTQFPVSGAQNAAVLAQGCVWSAGTASCPNSSLWQTVTDSGKDPQAGCANAVKSAFWASDLGRRSITTTTNGSPFEYALSTGELESIFSIAPLSNACPAEGSQTGYVGIDETYYAIYDPVANEHDIIAVTDDTVSAAQDTAGTLFACAPASQGSQQSQSQLACGRAANGLGTVNKKSMPLPEAAWFLGKYEHWIGFSSALAQSAAAPGTAAPGLAPNQLVYRTSQSYPTTAITFTGQESSTSQSISVNVGVFGPTGSGSVAFSTTTGTSETITAPDWTVTQALPEWGVGYIWTTAEDANGDPLTWDAISARTAPETCGSEPLPCSGPVEASSGLSFAPNTISHAGLVPATLTTFTGAPIVGPVTVTSTRTVSLVDHYSAWVAPDKQLGPDDALLTDGFRIITLNADDPAADANTGTAIQPSPTGAKDVGQGIDFCDPSLVTPSTSSGCAALKAGS